MNTSKAKEKRIHCYNSSQKILLVGEGNFSFSACLARALRSANNIVATSYHDQYLQVIKHPTSITHLEELKTLGCLLVFEVDVNKMDTHPVLKEMKFDVIIYNFPHAGHYCINETSLWLIEMHRKLVGAYFKSASKMLNEGGEVHLRHRDDSPYNKWNVVSLAGESGLKLKDKVMFHICHYPGYSNIRGGDVRTNETFPISCAFTFKFSLDLLEIDRDDMKYNEVNDDGLEKKDLDVLVHPKKVEVLDQFVSDTDDNRVSDQTKDHEHACDVSKKEEDHDEQNLLKKAESNDENEISRIGLSNSVSKTELKNHVKDEHIKTDKDVDVVHELKGLSLHDIIDQDQDA
ncbi:hypothetical protein CTI12_AA017090 [Artemisia annua]|uniref:25S rRNA (uridine-N(3))-methyltransferase BMT5-like domain-containing protein n=1 Tax=Artemisia annua TaxID=35608 RepID=A0A2U1QKQ2_ARTAN|nr:hypothetical protein CTI12_AA017090 [Artemisia annua]